MGWTPSLPLAASMSHEWIKNNPFKERKRGPMKVINVIGVDLAKNVFQLHGNDRDGHTVFQKRLSRNKLLPFIANLPPCLIGMESCGGSNFWAREFEKLGHTVKQMAPQFVKPYLKGNKKNDAVDAEAIAEAVVRPNMRFVPIKNREHHDIQTIHRIRSRLVKSRTALINEFHGLLIEYGIVLSLSKTKMRIELRSILDAQENEAIGCDAKIILNEMLSEWEMLQKRVEMCDGKLEKIAKNNEACRRIQGIPGVGLITATAIVAAVPDAKNFDNGRQFSAWMGLVPKQHSSGGKNVLLGISKNGNTYLRTLLVHGGRSVLRMADKKTDRMSVWAIQKQKTRGNNRAIVAIANKNARMIWALMTSGESYRVAA